MAANLILFFLLMCAVQVIAYRYYENETRWLLTDYFWLIIASVALVFYGMKAAQLNDNGRLYTLTNSFASYEASYVRSIPSTINDLDHMVERVSGWEPKPGDTQLQDAVELRERLKAAMLLVEKEGLRTFLKGYSHSTMADGITSSFVLKKLDILEGDFNEINQRYREIDNLTESVSDTTWTGIEYWIYPKALALALALRLGRTTADFRRKTRQAKRAAQF